MKISIITPTFNEIENIEKLYLEIKNEFAKINCEYEHIIIDNNSTDGSQDWIRKNHPDVILIENKSNYGYAGGCNKGAKIAKGNYLLFLNNDTIQDSGWLEPMIELFEKTKRSLLFNLKYLTLTRKILLIMQVPVVGI